MSTDVSIQLGYKDSAWFTTNASFILLEGQIVYLDDQSGKYKLGDGVTDLATLNFLGGVSDVPLGLIQIVDLNGDFFTDLATASAYVATFNVGGIISDESYYPIGGGGIYYFTVPQFSDFSGDEFFLSIDIFTPTIAYIVDSLGLITVFSNSLCLNNHGNNVFRNITFGGDSFNLSSGINIYNNVSADTPSFAAASGKFLFNGTVAATGIYLSDFFLGSTATILTNKDNLGNTALIQAKSNGANVQFDGINLATLNDVALKLPIEATQTTGVALTFVTDSVYGTIASPETGNITYSATGAVLGVTNIIIHNHSSSPTFGTNMKKLSGSGDYVLSVVNYIYVTYINSTEVIYSINQRT